MSSSSMSPNKVANKFKERMLKVNKVDAVLDILLHHSINAHNYTYKTNTMYCMKKNVFLHCIHIFRKFSLKSLAFNSFLNSFQIQLF